MPAILAILMKVYRNELKCIYLKNQKKIVNSFLHF